MGDNLEGLMDDLRELGFGDDKVYFNVYRDKDHRNKINHLAKEIPAGKIILYDFNVRGRIIKPIIILRDLRKAAYEFTFNDKYLAAFNIEERKKEAISSTIRMLTSRALTFIKHNNGNFEISYVDSIEDFMGAFINNAIGDYKIELVIDGVIIQQENNFE